MQETSCPQCGGTFASAWGVKGAPEDGSREHYCSEECRDRGERPALRMGSSEQTRSRWHRETPTRGCDRVNWGGKVIPAADVWDILDGLADPFAE